jgi:hypothetical protein
MDQMIAYESLNERGVILRLEFSPWVHDKWATSQWLADESSLVALASPACLVTPRDLGTYSWVLLHWPISRLPPPDVAQEHLARIHALLPGRR